MKIRPFTPNDSEYKTILRLRNVIQPDNPSSVTIWQHNDQNRSTEMVFQRFVVEKADELVAYGQFEETAVNNRTFRIDVQIHPAYQAGRLTGRLYTHLIEALQSHQPARLLTQIRENETINGRFPNLSWTNSTILTFCAKAGSLLVTAGKMWA
jgi:hypothetical protein